MYDGSRGKRNLPLSPWPSVAGAVFSFNLAPYSSFILCIALSTKYDFKLLPFRMEILVRILTAFDLSASTGLDSMDWRLVSTFLLPGQFESGANFYTI
jgi:hypothetical protein